MRDLFWFALDFTFYSISFGLILRLILEILGDRYKKCKRVKKGCKGMFCKKRYVCMFSKFYVLDKLSSKLEDEKDEV